MAELTELDKQRLQGLARLGFAQADLIIIGGPDKGARFGLSAGENIIGRTPEAAVTLPDGEVSRRQARIQLGSEIELEDLGSAVGTILNGRMMMGRDFIFDNDELRIGPYTLRLELKRRESRAGVLVAAVLLGLAIAVCALALAFPDLLRPAHAAPHAETSADARRNTGPSWRAWDNLVLPDRATLETAGVPVTAAAAAAQFDLGSRLYDDRFANLGNAYQALLYYKRALAILRHIDAYETRPPVAARSLKRIGALQEMIRAELDKRVFAFQRYYHQRWWPECYRSLNEMLRIVPYPRDRHHRWAARQHRSLKRMLEG